MPSEHKVELTSILLSFISSDTCGYETRYLRNKMELLNITTMPRRCLKLDPIWMGETFLILARISTIRTKQQKPENVSP
jgi:hypothetical protein